jgi:integrase
MVKRRGAKRRRPWNKGREVRKKAAFTPAQVKRIRQVLVARGAPGLRDLTLFQVAIDTMLHGPDLFNLTVKDVQLPNGKIRSVIKVARRGGMPPVRCAFSKTTASALGKWIAVSGKKRADYLFPGRGTGSPRPMGVRHMNRLALPPIRTALSCCSAARRRGRSRHARNGP